MRVELVYFDGCPRDKCRLYRVSGASVGVPPERWIAAAIDDAT